MVPQERFARLLDRKTLLEQEFVQQFISSMFFNRFRRNLDHQNVFLLLFILFSCCLEKIEDKNGLATAYILLML